MIVQPTGAFQCRRESLTVEYVMLGFPGVFASREVPEPIIILWLLF
jgi:hypothetical protein